MDETQQSRGTHTVSPAYTAHAAGYPSRLTKCKKSDCSDWWQLIYKFPDLYKLTIEETTDLLSEKPDINRYHYSFYLLTEVY